MVALPFAATTPTSISRVGIRARDAENLARYYRDVIGLTELSRSGGAILLGAGERPLLEIEPDRAAKPDDLHSAGLFHNAFLLPSRADLGRWIKHAMDRQISIEGASDHLVSEALYLSDPEGNGIEVYADRPREQWARKDGALKMATIRLNIPSVLADVPEGDAGWQGAPDASIIGHVHLRVGDPAEAERWWHEELGFDTMARYGGEAVFLSSGGYHHHIGANSWRSPGAGRRDPERAGLSWVELRSTATEPAERVDPWGTVIRTVAE